MREQDKVERSHQLYDILTRRAGSYKHLLSALKETGQDEAVKILESVDLQMQVGEETCEGKFHELNNAFLMRKTPTAV